MSVIRRVFSKFVKRLDTSDYAKLGSKEEKAAAIAAAHTVDQLDAMWAAWEQQGFSREGLTFADILNRKRELGEVLSPEQLAVVDRVAHARKAGAALPPISGRVGPNGEG